MLKLKTDGQYILTVGAYSGKSLSWCLKHRRHWLHTKACCMADNLHDVAIVTAALDVWDQGEDPDQDEFWAAVDAIVGEKATAEDEWREYDDACPRPPY